MQVEEKNTKFVITLKGDIDTRTSPVLRNEIINKVCSLKKDVVLNLKQVEYVDSSGINVFLTVHKIQHENGKKLTLANVNETIRKILLLGQFDRILNIEK